jgi:hypothetical protein
MYFNDCMFSVSSTGYAVTSTAGLLSMVACLVYNTSTGGGISCVNGANGVSTYNFLVSIATNKDIACGTAVSIIGGDVQYASLTGVAIVFPARIQAALAGKLSSKFSGIQAIVDGEDISYYSTLADLLGYLNTLDTETTTGVVLNFAPGSYAYEGNLTFPSLRLVLNGNNSLLSATGNLSFARNVIIRNFDNITSGGHNHFRARQYRKRHANRSCPHFRRGQYAGRQYHRRRYHHQRHQATGVFARHAHWRHKLPGLADRHGSHHPGKFGKSVDKFNRRFGADHEFVCHQLRFRRWNILRQRRDRVDAECIIRRCGFQRHGCRGLGGNDPRAALYRFRSDRHGHNQYAVRNNLRRGTWIPVGSDFANSSPA